MSMTLLLSMIVPGVSAAGANVWFTVDKTSAVLGDSITVVLKNNEMNVDTFTCGILFNKDQLECKSIVSADPDYPDDFALTLAAGGKNPYVTLTASTVEDANSVGSVGFGVAQTESKAFSAGEIAVIVFEAKEGFTGRTEFSLYESSGGTDGYHGEKISTRTVWIEKPAAAPNIDYTVNKRTAVYGDDIIVTLRSDKMNVDTFTGGLSFDKEKLECKSITSPDPENPDDFVLTLADGGKNPYVPLAVSSVEGANETGHIGFGAAHSSGRTFSAGEIAVIVFAVREDAVGAAELSLYESSGGLDGYTSDRFDITRVSIEKIPETANVQYSVSRNTISSWDTVTVILSNKGMIVDTFACGIEFDPTVLECTSIVSSDPDYPDDFCLVLADGGKNPYVTLMASDVETANANGTVGFGAAHTENREFAAGEIASITFKLKAGASGKTVLSLYESSGGTNGFIGEDLDKVTVTVVEHAHTWNDATCIVPKTCAVCGETEGSALGHKWQNATCTAPKTCSTCGETEGSALGHKWQNATCTAPKTCSTCGETEGSALGHKWQNATCTAPKTCSTCGETDGAALGHKWQGNTCTSCGADKFSNTVSGTVTSFLEETGAVTLQLVPAGEKNPIAEQILTGNSASYVFENVPVGEYTLTVSKKNHGVLSQKIIVSGNMTLNLKICPVGDVSGDGRIRIIDVSMLYSSFRGLSSLSEYALTCGDVSGDGRIRIIDVSMLYSHFRGLHSFWT